MKTRLTLSICTLLFDLGCCFSQIVPSSCEAPDSVKAIYQDDADRLALKKILAYHLPYEDSITIPEIYSDSFLNPLIAVYNATSIPERDTVVEVFKIHEFPSYRINMIQLSADSVLPWMQQLRQSGLPSGYGTLDSLLERYGMELEEYYDHYGFFSWHTAYFRSDTNYNVKALVRLFDTLPEVKFAEPVNSYGDGDHITIYNVDFPFHMTTVIYFLGWGDCPAGCTDGRSWYFNVYEDCSVEFVGAYGSHVPFTATEERFSVPISIQPNPFDDFILIQGFNETITYSISNLSGQELIKGISHENRIDHLGNLMPGIYFLTLRSEHRRTAFKIIKK